MLVKCQSSGDIISLDTGQPLGEGGEGVIYRLDDKSDFAAKIYHLDRMNDERVGKLKAMLANAPADPMRDPKREKKHASIAWPVELVMSLDGNQDTIGFLMPLIRHARPISDYYDVETRHAQFPLFSYDSLCRTARNLASAVRALHRSDYVIGDVNESNILVTNDALVTLVDTDSFQVTDPIGGRVYRCPVGREMFTPPELHGKNFAEIDRAPVHDLFGIAVLFFQLLMEGQYPFAGVLRAGGNPPDHAEWLIRGYFPYGGHPLVAPPPGALSFETLHPSLQKLFRQCFVDGHTNPQRRPDSHTWYQALKQSEEALTTCARNSQHYYFKHCTHCPWCERARRFTEAGLPNWDPFPPLERAQEFAHYNYAAAQSSANSRWTAHSVPTPTTASIPTAAPATPSSFSASATTVTLGQAVTLQWSIPQAQTVWVTDQRGHSLFTGNASSGSVTIYPAKTTSYHIAASGVGVSLPSSITVSVTQVPQPVTLSQARLELQQATSLNAVRVGLRPTLWLNEIAVKLASQLRLRHYRPLDSYIKLRRLRVS
jgi:serine/threonine protein kinase